jgi:hypothetical protein
MDYVLIFLAGAILGWFWHARSFFQRVLDDPDRMITLLTELKHSRLQNTASQGPVWLDVEWINGRCYLWERDSRVFVGQGDTVESAVDNSQNLRPNTEYRIQPEQAKNPN